MEDTSLDDFFDGGSGEESTEGDESADTDAAGSDQVRAGAEGSEPADAERDESGPADDIPSGSTGDDSPNANVGSDGTESDVDPASPTMVYAPDGGPCAGCDAVVERRWRAGEDLFCADCAEW